MKSLNISKGLSEALNPNRTENIMSIRSTR